MSQTRSFTRLRRGMFAALCAAMFAVAASNDATHEKGGVQTSGGQVPSSLSGYIIAVG